MKDIELYIDKLHADAEDCLTISRTAATSAKRDVFSSMADTYRKLAVELERIVAANEVLDGERDKRLLGLLGTDDGDRSPDLENLFEQSHSNYRVEHRAKEK